MTEITSPSATKIRRAHALLLQGPRDDAKAIYAQYRGKKIDAERSAETLIAQDFAALRAAGCTRLMRPRRRPRRTLAKAGPKRSIQYRMVSSNLTMP